MRLRHGVFVLVLLVESAAFVFRAPRPRVRLLRSTPEEVEVLWRAHSRKPLLRVGRSGVQASHQRSLTELLAAHGYVCVKINGCAPDRVADLAEALRPADAAILLTKGPVVLYAASPPPPKEERRVGES